MENESQAIQPVKMAVRTRYGEATCSGHVQALRHFESYWKRRAFTLPLKHPKS